MQVERRRESPGQLSEVFPAKFVSEKTARRGGKRAVDESHHHYYAAHYIVDTVVGFAKRMKYHTRCVEAHDHHHQHSDIQKGGVFGNGILLRLACC